MRKVFFAIIIFAFLSMGIVAFGQQEEIPYGISIDQSSLDILTLSAGVFNDMRFSAEYDQAISIKAKVIVGDVFDPNVVFVNFSDMIFDARIELIKTFPDTVRLNMTSSLGEIQFLTSGVESIAVLPQDGLFAKTYFPEVLPSNMILPYDDGGLFTMLNIFGGIPFGSFITGSPVGGGGTPIDFVEDIAPEDINAVIRYRGTDKTEGGLAYVITIGSNLYRQYMKIWILKDTLQPYQISIEDERGTEVFVVFDELDASTMAACETITIDTTGMNEVSQEELFGLFLINAATTTLVGNPVVADLYLSHDPAARTGTVTVSSDGFDMQDMEHKLNCEIQYKSISGQWIPLPTVYAGLPPVGHWNADFNIPINAELGKYGFRVKYTDTSGNTSDWVEYTDLLTVTPEPPRITKVVPAYLGTDIPVSTKVSVTFSKPMNKESAQNSLSMVSQKKGIIRGSFNWEGNTMIFTPNADLDYETRYLLNISGKAKDTDNIGLDGDYDAISNGEYYDDYVWEFTTEKVSPSLAFTPVNRSIYAGDIFDLTISAKNVQKLYNFSFNVRYDPEFFEIIGFKKMSFLSWRPASSSARGVDLWKNVVINNINGTATFACEKTRNGGVSGSGSLATITVKCKAPGKSAISFSNIVAHTPDNIFIEMRPRGVDIQAIEYSPLDKNHDGVVDILDQVEDAKAAPAVTKFSLDQNYPNPFNPETWIPYQLATPADVTIKIYKLNGEIARSLDLGYKPAGFYTDRTKSAYWDGKDDYGQKVSSGIYFYTIQADSYSATKKMIVTK